MLICDWGNVFQVIIERHRYGKFGKVKCLVRHCKILYNHEPQQKLQNRSNFSVA